ncbi:MAG: YIP1 family protein, partial [Saccharofermentanales bacterium]
MSSGIKKSILLGAIAAAIVVMCILPARAESAYRTYVYDDHGIPRDTAPAYLPDEVVTGEMLGCGDLLTPADLYVKAQKIYVLDSGNDRVIRINGSFDEATVLIPKDLNGQAIDFGEAAGITVSEVPEVIVIADKQKGVFVFDHALNLQYMLEQVDPALFPPGFVFTPQKVEIDKAGLIYVISANSYQGALQYNEKGRFIGFFGAEKVSLTVDTLVNQLWKKVLTEKQISRMRRSVPVEFVSFSMNKDGFMYTVRKGNDISFSQVKCLNAVGENVLPTRQYGDIGVTLQLIDITVDDNDFFTVLDSGSGRILQYDDQGNLLYAFSGKGNQKGLSSEPCAIASMEDRLILLDSLSGTLTVFDPTKFAVNVRDAVLLSNKGRYMEALEPWENVIASDAAYELANKGLARAFYGMGDFITAMKYFRNANEQKAYGEVFQDYRNAWVSDHFGLLMFVLIILVVGSAVLDKILRRRRKSIYELQLSGRTYPFYCSRHPLIGFEDMKERHSDSFSVTIILVLAFFVVSIMRSQLTGFIFMERPAEDFNLGYQFLSTVGVFVLFVIGNWSVTTIMNGKGKLKEIANFCAAALTPYIIGTVILVILSRVFSYEETAFYLLCQVIMFGWTAVTMFFALKEVHMYSVRMNILTILLTLAGIVILIILCALAYSVITQLIEFLDSVIKEIRLI